MTPMDTDKKEQIWFSSVSTGVIGDHFDFLSAMHQDVGNSQRPEAQRDDAVEREEREVHT